MANRKLARAVRLALVTAGALGAGLYGVTGAAQEQLQEIVVTGSRIAQPNIEGASPVTVISSADVRVSGISQVEDLVNSLPQAFASQGSNISNGASGTATVNLRGLGSARTLVLLNGRRMVAGTAGVGGPYSPDLNQIPAPLIERVEVLTGGASAVYGSDAVAGVVNFIMKDNFEGVQFDVNYNFNNHRNDNSVADIVAARGFALPKKSIDADGEGLEVSVLMGSNFADGRGNATLFLGYRDYKALLQSERDFSACALGSSAAGFSCGGSSTSYPGRFIDLNSGDEWTVADAAGAIRPWTTSDIYNYGPLNYFQRPETRYSMNASGHYDVSDWATVYTEIGFHDDTTVAQIAPSGLFGLVTPIGCSNPLLSAAWVNAICTSNGLGPTEDAFMFILRRNVEGGGRQDDLRHTSYRGVVGMKGTVADHWDYDVSMQYSAVVYADTYLNDFSYTRAGRAMDVITDTATGQPACQSFVDGTDPACVPYNIWVIGGPSQAALNYLQTPGFQRGQTTQTVISGSMSADLGAYGAKFPTANDGIGIAFGANYGDDGLSLKTDTAFASGDLFGQGGPRIGVEGNIRVKDLFLETRMPLVQGKTGAEDLTLSASYRYSDYSINVETNTYGVGLDWSPTEDFKLRASYQRAVRAPAVYELFQTQSVGLYDNDEDPCAGATPTRTAAECARTGVTAAQYGTIIDNPAGQYNALFGGNPNLDPEESDSVTFGVVFTPSFVDNLNVTVDYWTIKVDKAISSLNPVTTLSSCLDTGDPLFCSLITRDQLGTLWATPQAQIVSTNINLSTFEVTGIDFAANYRQEIGTYGSLGFSLVGTYIEKWITEEIPGAGKYDCVGLYGPTCGTPTPEWRHRFRTTWATPWDMDVSLTWRYYGGVLLDRTSSNPLLTGVVREVDRKFGAQNYIDLAASKTFAEKYTFGLGINNVTDKDPPVSAQVGAGFGNGNTYPQVYDSFGRYVFLNMSAKF